MFNHYKMLLRDLLVKIRMSKPRAVVAEETDIAEKQLEKFCAPGCDTYVPNVLQHVRLVRSISEASPVAGLQLAQAGVPSELFRVVPAHPNPDALVNEVIQIGVAVGRIMAAYEIAMQGDNRIDATEFETIKAAVERTENELAELRAALDASQNQK